MYGGPDLLEVCGWTKLSNCKTVGEQKKTVRPMRERERYLGSIFLSRALQFLFTLEVIRFKVAFLYWKEPNCKVRRDHGVFFSYLHHVYIFVCEAGKVSNLPTAESWGWSSGALMFGLTCLIPQLLFLQALGTFERELFVIRPLLCFHVGFVCVWCGSVCWKGGICLLQNWPQNPSLQNLKEPSGKQKEQGCSLTQTSVNSHSASSWLCDL